MSDQPGLKREGTMAVTAQEGEAFLQSQGMKVTDDDVKTRAQKEKLDEITSAPDSTSGESAPEKPKVPREGTMVVTAKEGEELLGGESLEKTRAQTEASKQTEESPKKPRLPRDSTMAVTAQEGMQLLEGEELEKTRGQTAAASAQKSPVSKVKRTTTIAQTTEDSNYILGSEERGRTRSQTRKFSETEGDDKKPAVKRASTMEQTKKEGEEFLAREAKRAKTDDDNDQQEEAAPEETKAEA